MTRYSSWSVLFAMASLCLIAVLWLRLDQATALDMPTVRSKTMATAGPGNHVATAARLGKRNAYAAIAERPLFSPTRRPVTAPLQAGTSQPRKSLAKFVLSGIIIVSPEEKIALLREAKSPDTQRLSEGQEIAGWRIEKILPDRVILVSGDETAEIELWSERQPPPRQTRQPGQPGQTGRPSRPSRPRQPGIKLPTRTQRK